VAERLRQELPQTFENVPGMGLLPEKLRADLLYQICEVHLLKCPFMRLCACVDAHVFETLIMNVCEVVPVLTGDSVFLQGSEATAAVIVMHGAVQYIQEPGSSRVLADVSTDLLAGAMLSEAALWCYWDHVGSAVSASCEIMFLHAESFGEVLFGEPSKRVSMMSELLIEYAKIFHTRLVSALPPVSQWPNDIEVPFASYEEIVIAMADSSRTFIGMVSIRLMQASTGDLRNSLQRVSFGTGLGMFGKVDIAALEKEVSDRKCVLLISGAGEVQRVVAVLALRLVRDDGRVLVQLGKVRKGQVQLSCKLPGKLLKDGALPGDELQRVLDSELVQFSDGIEVYSVETAAEWKHSAQHNVKTQYIRTVYFADFQDSHERDLVTIDTAHWAEHSPEAASCFADDEVFALADGDNNNSAVIIYAWLTAERLDFYGTSAGEASLRGCAPFVEDTIVQRCRTQWTKELWAKGSSLNDGIQRSLI
jgi:hypothetical protein